MEKAIDRYTACSPNLNKYCLHWRCVVKFVQISDQTVPVHIRCMPQNGRIPSHLLTIILFSVSDNHFGCSLNFWRNILFTLLEVGGGGTHYMEIYIYTCSMGLNKSRDESFHRKVVHAYHTYFVLKSTKMYSGW